MPKHSHTFTPDEQRVLEILRTTFHASRTAIVAGGWVRDAVSGHAPQDIDVFVASEEIERTVRSLSHQKFELVAHEWTEQVEDDCVSSGEMVENVWTVKHLDGMTDLPVQLIEVASPRAWVPLFDAHCNMMYVPLKSGDFEVYSCSPHAVAHAKLRIWEVNPDAQESESVLMKRADKFEARGFKVRRTPLHPVCQITTETSIAITVDGSSL